MFLNDPLDIRQTHAGAFRVSGVMEALKNAEKLANIGHVKANSVIANEDDSFPGYFGLPYVNRSPTPKPGELEGIREKVYEHLLHERRIALGSP